MKQRLGIAAAIMHEPELLILDEPINGLDPIGIHEIRNFLLLLCKERGVTILLSSHVLSEIEQVADVIGVMHEGKLLEEVDMKELHKRNRQYVELQVSDENKACLLLEEKYQFSDYSVHPDGIIRIYSNLNNRANWNRTFVENGIEVSSIHLSEEKLEDYFTNMIGGGIIG
jgi:bacitracin transport system ATP-binding protein